MAISPTPQPPHVPERVGAWFGVAGCLFTVVTAAAGSVIGVLIGISQMPPEWDHMHGSEFHGLSVDMERLTWLVGGLVVGFAVGTLLGVIASVLAYRRWRRGPSRRPE